MDVVVTVRDGIETTRITSDELADEIKATADSLYEKAVGKQEPSTKVITTRKDQN